MQAYVNLLMFILCSQVNLIPYVYLDIFYINEHLCKPMYSNNNKSIFFTLRKWKLDSVAL